MVGHVSGHNAAAPLYLLELWNLPQNPKKYVYMVRTLDLTTYMLMIMVDDCEYICLSIGILNVYFGIFYVNLLTLLVTWTQGSYMKKNSCHGSNGKSTHITKHTDRYWLTIAVLL